MTATAADTKITAPDFIASVAALCGEDEAALVLVYAKDGISYCVSSDQGAHRTAIFVADAGQDDEADTLLGVAVISRNGTLTEYSVRN